MASDAVLVRKHDLRLFEHHVDRFLQAQEMHPGKYENFSHYVRCALEVYHRALQEEWMSAGVRPRRVRK